MGRYWRTLLASGYAVAVQLEHQANAPDHAAVAMSLSGSLFLLSLFYGSIKRWGPERPRP